MGEAALKINLAPVGLTYNLNGKEKLVLDSSDRLDLQRYVMEGMTLPASKEALKAAFDLKDSMLNDFNDLLKAFQDIQKHCDTFYNGAFTQSVTLTSSIIEFDTSAKYYLNGIATIADDFEHNRVTAEYAEKAVTALLDVMGNQLNKFIADCEKVCKGVSDFLNETYKDNVTMNGQDGKSGLKKTYTDKYNLNQDQIKRLNDDLTEAQRELDQVTEEYNYDVTVAATTPTYVWIVPFGTIPAVIVAGVYGDRAVKAYKRMGELRDKIRDETAELQQKMAMTAGLSISSRQVSKLAELVKKAIQPIEKMKGTWEALKSDLGALDRTVKEDIAALPMCVKQMGVKKALEQWDRVAKEAEEYRKNAFISETSKNLVLAEVIRFPNLKKA